MNKEKELAKRKLLRLQNDDYSTTGVYFITICTKDRRCILSRVLGTENFGYPKIELTEYGKIADKYIKQLNEFYDHISVKSYVIMPNHIHLLLHIKGDGQSGTPAPNVMRANSAFSQFISTFKRFCNKEYGKNIWQTRANDHIIRNQDDYEEHLRYIYENPIRWHSDELYVNE